jgi:uncharacterized protein involved in exopolysaccharide biosynthesis
LADLTCANVRALRQVQALEKEVAGLQGK